MAAENQTERLKCHSHKRISGRTVFQRPEEAVSMRACYTRGGRESQLDPLPRVWSHAARMSRRLATALRGAVT